MSVSVQHGPSKAVGVGIYMTDDQERQVAAEIEQSHPHWVVLWGCYGSPVTGCSPTCTASSSR
jgi:hypothetical protein